MGNTYNVGDSVRVVSYGGEPHLEPDPNETIVGREGVVTEIGILVEVEFHLPPGDWRNGKWLFVPGELVIA